MRNHKPALFVAMAGAIMAWCVAGSQPALADTTVTLEQPVHFTTAEGSDVVLDAGSYAVEAAEEWLRVIPGERREAWLLEAIHTTHEEPLDAPEAFATHEEGDQQHIVLLLPGGIGFESIGSVSGIRSRAVTRQRTSQTRARQQQATRIPTQTKQSSVIQKSKPLPTSPVQPMDPVAQRVQTLEQQVSSLTSLVNTLQGQLNLMASAIQVDNAGRVTIGQASIVTIQGSVIKILASAINAQAATSKFSGVVQSDTLITNSVVSASYTPGAGNIW